MGCATPRIRIAKGDRRINPASRTEPRDGYGGGKYDAAGCRSIDPAASRKGSRTTSDFEILGPRDSASMSAMSGSGKRTVRVFMELMQYVYASDAGHTTPQT